MLKSYSFPFGSSDQYLNVYPSFDTSGAFKLPFSFTFSVLTIFSLSTYVTVYSFISSVCPYKTKSFFTSLLKLYLFVYFLSVYHPLKFLLSTFGSLIFSPSSTVSSLYVFPSKIYTIFSYISPFAVTLFIYVFASLVLSISRVKPSSLFSPAFNVIPSKLLLYKTPFFSSHDVFFYLLNLNPSGISSFTTVTIPDFFPVF